MKKIFNCIKLLLAQFRLLLPLVLLDQFDTVLKSDLSPSLSFFLSLSLPCYLSPDQIDTVAVLRKVSVECVESQ